MSEASRFFQGRSEVQEALKRITAILAEMGIPQAVCEGMALFAHGYRRFTEDVDILVTRESLSRIHKEQDVFELISLLGLSTSFAESLNSDVRPKFLELCDRRPKVPKRYVLLWRNKWLTSEAKTIDDMILALHSAAATLTEMRDAGVSLDPGGGTADDYAHLVTTDPLVAERYGLEDESELFEDGESDDEPRSDDNQLIGELSGC